MTAPFAQDEFVEPRLLRTPDIHGDTIVFSYASNLWVANTQDGSVARRLTSVPSTRPKISPDGKTVAFTATYDGGPNVYTVPIEGGEPKRLTFDNENDNTLGWTPDGKYIAYSTSGGNFINRQQRLNLVGVKGGLPIRTKINEISELSYYPDGKQIAYTRFNSYLFNWRRYRGGSQGRISFYDFDKNSYSEIPSGREQSYFPMVVGSSVYYISDKANGALNLYRYDRDRKSDTQLTKYSDADIKTPSSDGKSIVFERDGYLNLYDLASNKVRKLSPRILSENLLTRPVLHPLGGAIRNFSLSPSGVRLAVEARGEIFSVPVKQGDTRDMTNTSGVREGAPQWSPDGQSILYISDATGETELYTMPQLGSKPTQLTSAGMTIIATTWTPDSKKVILQTLQQGLYSLDVATKALTKIDQAPYGFGGSDVSPDSRYLAYIKRRDTNFGQLFIADLTTGKTTQVTDGMFSDQDVAFDLNGKYLYLDSSRTFSPSFGDYEFSLKVENSQRIYVIPLTASEGNPLTPPDEEEPSGAPAAARPTGPPPGAQSVKIDFDKLGDRLIPLPIPPDTYNQAGLIGANNGVFFTSNGVLSKFDLGSRESTPIVVGLPGGFTMNQNRTKLAVYAGGTMSVVDVHPGASLATGRVDLSGVQAVINPRDEWKEIFWEAWRFERDNYYDPTFRGQDWKKIGDHYASYLQYVHSRADLNYVLGLMLGELGTSHAYVLAPGDLGVSMRPIPTGRLGADYELEGDHVKFAKIYRGLNFEESRRGPLGEPGVNVNEGDYLLQINGQAVSEQDTPDMLLANQIDRFVNLTVNSKPTLEGARTVRVRPVASETELRYIDFVDGNRRKVDELSQGRIGYMHIINTSQEGAIDFVRGFYPQADKDAMIVDERWNGGGYIQPWFVDTLARKVKAYIQPRNGADGPDEAAIDGPKAMLINGYAGSGGDFFPWMFRHANLGPLIGTRTWGGLVGIGQGADLVDGGSVSAPGFSIYDPSTIEIIAENQGIQPDIDVDNRPDLVANGEDPQLEAAVKYLMDKLKAVPERKPRDRFPQVGKLGQVKP